MQQEVKNWFMQAKVDLKSAQTNYQQKIYYVASFLSQQAAEKALKALLLQKDFSLPKVHDLVFLAKKAGASEDLLAQCDELTWVYIETRYPDLPGKRPSQKFTKGVAAHHVCIAQTILRWVQQNISRN